MSPSSSLWHEIGWAFFFFFKKTIRISGIYFSYNKKEKDENNLVLYQIFKSFDLWKMITIALEGRIVVFRTLAILKKVFQALLTIFHTWLSKN